MSRTITITIHEPYLKVLENWASVSRTLNTAKQACEDIQEVLEDNNMVEKAHFCAKELETLAPALDHLHQQARNALWEES